MFFINLETSHSSTIFIFASFIFISSGPNTTSKKFTSLTFYLHFSGFTSKLFSSNLFNISVTNSLCLSFVSILTIILLIKLPTFSMFIKSLCNLFITVWNIASELVNPKNVTVGSKDSSGVVKAIFYLSPSFILILLYHYHKSIFVNIFLVPIFLITSKESSSG